MDIELLANSLGRSVDDTVLCVHMVLVQITAHVSNRKWRRITVKKGKCCFSNIMTCFVSTTFA